MALPQTKLRWVGGDATLTRVGAVDWGRPAEGETPSHLVVDPPDLIDQLKRAAGAVENEEAIIAVLELLAYVVMAAVNGARW